MIKSPSQVSEAAHQKPANKVELRRELPKLESYATIIGILVGSGIFVVTGKSGAVSGPSVPLAYLVLVPVVLVMLWRTPYISQRSSGPPGTRHPYFRVFGSPTLAGQNELLR